MNKRRSHAMELHRRKLEINRRAKEERRIKIHTNAAGQEALNNAFKSAYQRVVADGNDAYWNFEITPRFSEPFQYSLHKDYYKTPDLAINHLSQTFHGAKHIKILNPPPDDGAKNWQSDTGSLQP